jgi:UDP-N-acetyl-D-galactosamine dehydrogenase
MATYVGQQTINKILESGESASGARVTILGLTFKENCSDLRNSKVVDLINYLNKFGCDVSVHDSIANDNEAKSEYGLNLNEWDDLPPADALVVAVSHKEYLDMSLTELLEKLKPGGIFVDVKSQFPKVDLENRGFSVWRL